MPAYDQAEMERLGKQVKDHYDTYLASGGARGHIEESFVDPGNFVPMLLLRTIGAKSGQIRIVPLGYGYYDGCWVIAATKAGADEHPAWYHNIKAGGEVAFQVGTDAFLADWSEAGPEKREALWRYMDTNTPAFAIYRASTKREIPLIKLRARERIAVFTA